MQFQPDLLNGPPTRKQGVLPSTRYQGSKHKILKWIDHYTKDLKFNTVLDAFGGTGCVGYTLKRNGKQVFYNDFLKFNYHIGLAIIENSTAVLTDEDVDFILKKHPETKYPTFIYDTFHEIYFTDEENEWLDTVATNIGLITDKYKKALAYYALFQSCIIKRPYNLFHRKNLYIRLAEVERSFGNKKTWDTSFEDHFRKFVQEGNNAVFNNRKKNRAFNSDVFDLEIHADLIYVDTPYISAKGVSVDYLNFYHFLEGITSYDQWADMIDENSKHKKMKNAKNEWCDRNKIHQAFEKLFEKFRKSIFVVSYRDNGIPTADELVGMFRKLGKKTGVKKIDYKYVLSNEPSREVLIIAE